MQYTQSNHHWIALFEKSNSKNKYGRTQSKPTSVIYSPELRCFSVQDFYSIDINNNLLSLSFRSSVQTPTSPTEQNTDSEDEDNNVPKLKDDTNLDIRRAESMRRQKYFRAKYNIPDKKDPEETTQDSRGQQDAVRGKWGLKRSKSHLDESSKSKLKDPRLLTKKEEMLERRNSKRQREAIRARYNLH